MKYTNEELITVLQREYKETKTIPSCNKKRKIHSNVFRNRFGSWNNVLELAGIPRRTPTKRRVVKKCSHCEKEFLPTRKDQQFCSVSCSNKSRRIHKPRLSREKWLRQCKEKSLQNLLESNFDTLSWDLKRRRVIYEQKGTCNKCGLKKWLGEELIIEVDHINGDNTDDRRENLEGLCPNCHSITPTWRGKNRANRKITDDELRMALEQSKNIRQALIKVGMSPRGANYKRAKELLGV